MNKVKNVLILYKEDTSCPKIFRNILNEYLDSWAFVHGNITGISCYNNEKDGCYCLWLPMVNVYLPKIYNEIHDIIVDWCYTNILSYHYDVEEEKIDDIIVLDRNIDVEMLDFPKEKIHFFPVYVIEDKCNKS